MPNAEYQKQFQIALPKEAIILIGLKVPIFQVKKQELLEWDDTPFSEHGLLPLNSLGLIPGRVCEWLAFRHLDKCHFSHPIHVTRLAVLSNYMNLHPKSVN